MKLSYTGSLLAALGRKRGPVTTALVYALGGRFYTRRLYSEQGRLAAACGMPGGYASFSFDIDYPEDVAGLEKIYGILEKLGIKASFAVVGRLVEDFPAEHRLLSRAGHEIINHTYSHPDNELFHPHERFDELTQEEQKGQIERCHDVCRKVLGVAPRGFRAPHFGNVTGRGFYKCLLELGYTFSSSVVSVDSPGLGLPFKTPEGVWEFPVSCCPEHPFAVLDTWNAFRSPRARHKKKGEFAALVAESAEMVKRCGGYLNLYMDPRDVVEYDEAADALITFEPHPGRPEIITYGRFLELLERQA
ncbi:MAG: polysaccharide deacetylase family protein [Gemmatimonadota bacterium]|nr:polysaccharide deacetylase family protein [Gemmatimonadota bacterium]